VVVVSGRMEISVSNGEVRGFGPGDLLLVDDTAGVGHTLRNDGDRRLVAIELPADLDLDAWSTQTNTAEAT
jgi:mannose-6-phosphate isomerase-like protein (cupin superfamily)